MQKINTIAVIGAGAVGCYFINGLREKFGENLWVIAEGERKERLKKEGLIVNGIRLPLHVKTAAEAHGADLVLTAVKYGALSSAVEDIEKVVGDHTIVMSLLNGVDSEEIIAEKIGQERIVYSMMKISSERKGNSIAFDPEKTQGVFFGEVNPEIGDERIRALEEVFAGTDIHYNICRNIIQDIWFKYALNISKNLPQAMINCGYGAYYTSENVKTLSRRLEDEVIAVAAAKGIDIARKEDSGNNVTVSPKARFSTLQDLDAKRHTEIDMFSGAMMRMGQELGIPTPYNEFTYYIIKALEEKNDGLLQ